MSICLRIFLLLLGNVDESSSKSSFWLNKMFPEYDEFHEYVNDEVEFHEYVNDEVIVANPEYVNQEVVDAAENKIETSSTSCPVSKLDVKEYSRPGHKRSEAGVYDSIYSTNDFDSDQKSRSIKDVNGIHRKVKIEQISQKYCWGMSKKKKIVISVLCIVLVSAIISGSTILSLEDEEISKTKNITKGITNANSSISTSPTMPSNPPRTPTSNPPTTPTTIQATTPLGKTDVFL